jgi:glycosyltransferase involved in cell wall biosynthesis
VTPLAAHLFYVRRAHWGAFSGTQRLIDHLDPTRVRVTATAVEDDDEWFPDRFPFRKRAVRDAVRRRIQGRGQPWYKLTDLAAEFAAATPWVLGRYDLLHYLDGEHTAQFLPAVARRRGASLATYHQPVAILPQVVVPEVVRRLDHVAVVSESQLAYFSRFMPASHLSVVHYGVDTDFFRPPAARDEAKPFTCVTVGSYLRDWELFAEVARRLQGCPDIVLHVVSTSAPLPDAVGNIVTHSRLDDEGLRRLYANADVLFLPLVDGTANNALVEAMAMGLPVVASDLPAVREYASPESAYFVERAPERFVEKIVALMNDPERRVAMGQAGRARAESLSWPRAAEQYLALYERLA